jgi:hypothetical protein
MQKIFFELNTSKSFALAGIMVLILSHCASEPTVEAPPPVENPYQLNVINNRAEIVDTVRLKPCGTPAKFYTTAANGLKPNERVMVNVYNVCVDVKAEDGFRHTLYEQSDLLVSKTKTLQLK